MKTPQNATTTTTTKWKRLLLDTPGALNNDHLFVSRNDKTGHSINVSIARTCHPTKACREYCYGMEGRIRYKASLKRQADNAAVFDRLAGAPQEDVDAEAALVAEEVRHHQDFLRMFGVGDLQPGSIRFITALSKMAPDLDLWVSTRRFDLAAKLMLDLSTGQAQLTHRGVYRVNPNAHLMLSLDATTSSQGVDKARELVQRGGGQVYLAWVQRSRDEAIPADVAVVFAEHHTGTGRAKWTQNAAHPRTCPATIAEGMEHQGACAACRFCFDLDVRRKALRSGRLKIIR